MSAPRRAGGSTIPERQGRSAPEARALGLVGRARGADGLANELDLVDVIGVLLTRQRRRSQRTEIRRTRYDERSRGRHRWRQSRETRKLRTPGVPPGAGVPPPFPTPRLPRYGGRGAFKPSAARHARISLATCSPHARPSPIDSLFSAAASAAIVAREASSSSARGAL